MTEPETVNPTSAHQHALTLAKLGLRVLPIRPGGKIPPFKRWQEAATNDPDKINNWYTGLYTKCGVGIALGPQPNGNNLFALDLDNHGDGDGTDELADLERIHGKLPDTWRSITGSGGAHLILRAPADTKIRNQQATGNRVAPNIDIRGEGGQIVVAPTIHPETLAAYEWEHDYAPWEIPIGDAPPWLLEHVTEQPAPEPTTPPPPETGTVFDLHRQDWNWHTELFAKGWTISHEHNGDSYWVRPGKDRRAGHSAILHGTEGPFVIFTTDIPQQWTHAASRTVDGSGWTFGPFGFYAATNHNGDRSAAAHTLKTLYGITDNLDGLIATHNDTETPPETPDLDTHLKSMVMSWPDFFATDHNTATWLWEPIIAEKRGTAIFAPGGVGKSLIMLRLGIDVARNGRNVLYLDYEMTPDDLADRLDDMGYDNPHTDLETLHYAQLPDLSAFDTKAGAQEVVRLAELYNTDLVIIDTFSRAIEGDENDADTYRRFYNMTGQELKRRNIGYIRLDHAGKDISKGQRGSSAKNDDVDVVWLLKRTTDGYQLTAKKRRMGWVPEEVNLTRSDEPFHLKVKGGRSYPEGTLEIVKLLDDLKVPDDASSNDANKAIKDANPDGKGKRRSDILAALNYRKERGPTYHFADDIIANPVDNPVDNRREPGREPPHPETAGTTPGTHPPETPPDQGRNQSGNPPEPPSQVYREPGSPPKGEPVPTPHMTELFGPPEQETPT